MVRARWLTPIYFNLPRKHRAIWRSTPIDDLQQRAMRILKGRTHSEIEAADAWIQKRLRETRESHTNDMLFNARCTIIMPARQLLIALRQIDLRTLGHMRDGQRREYFAMLALHLCSKVIAEWAPKLKDKEIDPTPIMNTEPAHEWLREAAEALLVAEALAESSSINGHDQPIAFLRMANRTAAIARHEPTQTIKERFASYASDKRRSRAELARRFYKSLTPAEKKQLCPSANPDNAVRTLTDYLKRRL